MTPYVSVVIPALNEAAQIASVVRYARSNPATAEVIVVDDSSLDDTVQLAAAAGARVISSSMLGKGASMMDGIQAARFSIIAFLDGDLSGLEPAIISKLTQPIVDGKMDFVKARFGRSGGRVTELTAKPMLKVFFPEVAGIAQPLGGIVAGQATLLRNLRCENGYGVDVGLLIDAYMSGARIGEVDVGHIEHESQPLHDLTEMANEVGRVIFERARTGGRLHVDQVAAMYEMQRQAASGIDSILKRRRGRLGVVLLDMDGTVSPLRFAVELARETGQETALEALLDGAQDDAITRSERIASLFRFVHKDTFERVAHSLPIRAHVVEFVNQMRRRDYMVGLVSDSYFVAAEIVRRRIFADFAIAHVLDFTRGTCDGTLRINDAFQDPGRTAGIDKANVARRFLADETEPRIEKLWAIGDNHNDVGMLELADRAIILRASNRSPPHCPKAEVIDSFSQLIN